MFNKIQKFHHSFWVINCLIGNVVQLYWISSQYFRYDISTNVQLLTPDRIDIPTVTMCFDLIRVLKWSAMTEPERQSVLIADGQNIFSQLEDLEGNYTIRDIEKAVFSTKDLIEGALLTQNLQSTFNTSDMFRVTFKPRDLFRIVFLFNPVKKNMDVIMDEKILEIRYFLRDNRMCYLFDVKQPSWTSNLSYTAIRKQPIISQNMLAVYGFEEATVWMLHDSIYILSAAGHSSRYDSNAFLGLPMKLMTSYTVTYNEYRSTLLPPPYATMCRNYSKEGLISKDGCYERCLRQLSLRSMRSLHSSLAVFPNETSKSAPFMAMYADKFANKIDKAQEVDNNCTEECSRRDCSTVLYIPRYLTSQRRTIKSTITQVVTLTPILQTNCLEQISLIQFLTDIASSLGFWLGMSAIGLANFVVSSIGRCKLSSYAKSCLASSNRETNQRTVCPLAKDHIRLERKIDRCVQTVFELDGWTRVQIDMLTKTCQLLENVRTKKE